jgi:hypothetical protein
MLPVSLMERAMLYDQDRVAMPMVDDIRDSSEIQHTFNARRTYYRGQEPQDVTKCQVENITRPENLLIMFRDAKKSRLLDDLSLYVYSESL